jgi:Outer membrane protein beta-barrel domain
MFKFRRILLVTSLLFLPLFAQAQINDGFYIGGGLGLSTFKLDEVKDDDGDIEGELVDENGFSYGINAGYAISNGILFELGYQSLYNSSHSPYEDFEIDTDLIATTLGMKLILPVDNGWGLFSRLDMATTMWNIPTLKLAMKTKLLVRVVAGSTMVRALTTVSKTIFG